MSSQTRFHPVRRLRPPDTGVAALARLSGPILIANLSIMASATIDTMMAGRLGAEHLAAVALGSACVVTVFISLVSVLMGLSPIAGHHWGAQEPKLVGFELGQSMWLGLLLCLIGAALLWPVDLWTGWGHAEGEVARMTGLYLRFALLGLPAAMFSRPFVAVNAAVSRPQSTMWVLLLMLLAKAPLNWLFMRGALGLPALGGAGAGLATAVDNWLGLTALWLIWRLDPFFRPLRQSGLIAPRLPALAAHLRLGVPIGLSTFFEVSSFTLMAIFISRFGAIELAGHQIVANITAVLYQVPFSLGTAAGVLVAQCLGAGHPETARGAAFRAIRVSVSLAAFGALALYLSRRPLADLYSADQAVRDLAVSLLIYGVAYHCMDAVQAVSCFVLRSYRVTVLPMLIYGSLLWAMGIGGGFRLAFYGWNGGAPWRAGGFWAATAAGLTLVGLVLFLLMAIVSRRVERHGGLA